MEAFLRLLFLSLVIIAVKYLFAIIWSYYTFRGANIIEYRIRDLFMDKLLAQAMPFFEKNPTGSLMAKATNDVSILNEFAGFGVLSFFDSTVFPLCILLVMIFTVDLRLTLLSVLPLPILAWLCIKIGMKIYERFVAVQEAFDRLNSATLEGIEGVRTIRAYNLQEAGFRNFAEKGEELWKAGMEVVKYEALITPIQRILPAMTFVIAIGYGVFLITKGEITPGELLAFTYYLNMLVWPMQALGHFIDFKELAKGAMERIQEIWDYPEDIVDKEGAPDLSPKPRITFKDLSFRYPASEKDNLTAIDVDLPYGKTLGVVGPTGSGKSTFLQQFLRLYPMEEKALYAEGVAVEDITQKSLRETMGYVPQNYMIFSKTLRENVAFGRPEATEEDIDRALQLADLQKDLENFPEGKDTLCGEKGISLSGGQKQRLALARALVKDPDILLLDDCMSAVDGETEKTILENLKRERKGKTTVIVAHRLSQVEHCDEILEFKDGKIVARGTHEELLEQKGWYERQYRRQLGWRRYL